MSTTPSGAPWMPDVVDVGLFVKPRFTDDWVAINPTSPTGQAFARSLGFTTSSPKEDTMSAVPIETTTQRHLRVVENNKKQMSLLLKAKAAFSAAWEKFTRAPKALWSWLKRTLHLDPVLGIARDGIRFAKEKASLAAHHLGATGTAGVGLLAISTGIGRSVLSTLLKPVGWTVRLIHSGYVWLEDRICAGDEPEGGYTSFQKARNFVAGKMADIREFIYKGALKVASFAAKYLHPVFQIDSTPMQVARTVGTGIVGFKMLPLVALIPLGGFALAGQYLATAGVAATTAASGWGLIQRITTWVKGLFGKAEQIATGETTKGADAVDIMTTAAETGEVIAHGTPVPADANRAVRRDSMPARKGASKRRQQARTATA